MTDTDFSRALPELRGFLAAFPGWDLTTGPPADVCRPFLASFPAHPAPEPSVATMESIEVLGGAGQPLRVLVIKPVGVVNPPVVFSIHGGGFLFGAPELDLPLHTFLASKGFATFAPTYRLAPEAPFPAAIKDIDAAYAHLVANGAALGVNTSRLGFYGFSAGSALATGLAIRLKNAKAAVQPKIVILDSVDMDDRVIYPSQADDHPLIKYHAAWSAKNQVAAGKYLNLPEDIPVDAFPLRSTDNNDFVGLPPHYISSCELDSLVDHGPEYAKRLMAAGVSTELHVFRGTIHAFVCLVPATEIAAAAREEYLRVFISELAV